MDNETSVLEAPEWLGFDFMIKIRLRHTHLTYDIERINGMILKHRKFTWVQSIHGFPHKDLSSLCLPPTSNPLEIKSTEPTKEIAQLIRTGVKTTRFVRPRPSSYQLVIALAWRPSNYWQLEKGRCYLEWKSEIRQNLFSCCQ